MKEALIRFNTQNDGKSNFWRVLIDSTEVLTDSVEILCPCQTVAKEVEGVGLKFHIQVMYNDLKVGKGIITLS